MMLDHQKLENLMYRKMLIENIGQKEVVQKLGLSSRRIFETIACGMDFKMSTLLRIMDWLGINDINEIAQ